MEAFDKVVLDLYESARGAGARDFSEHSINAVKKLFAFDSATLVDYAVSKQQEVLIQTLHLHSVPLEKLHERVTYTGVESLTAQGTLVSRDVVLQAAVGNRGRSVAADVNQVFRKDPLLDYCRRFDNAHSLVIASPTRDQAFSLAAFWRADQKKAYGAEDIALSTRLLPHLLQAKQVNQQLSALHAGKHESKVQEQQATVLATFDGCIYLITPAGVQLLQSEWEHWLPPLLPKDLTAFLFASVNRRYVGTAISVQASVQGKLLCLAISAKHGSDALTPAEFRVAQLASDGLQYKEIARSLHTSPATVRNQLQSVYRKLGVTNKTALASAMGLPRRES